MTDTDAVNFTGAATSAAAGTAAIAATAAAFAAISFVAWVAPAVAAPRPAGAAVSLCLFIPNWSKLF